MQKIKENKLFFTIFLSIVLTILVVLISYGNAKEAFHIDEIYTYGLSNSYYKPFPFDVDRWLPSDYYKNYLTTSYDTNFKFGSVYYNQMQDVHPPMYYLVIHTISSFLPGVFTKWIGLSFNIILSLSSSLIVFFLIKKIIKSKWVALTGMGFWALSVGGVSSTMFIRMYVMLGFIQLILLLLAIHYLNSDKFKKIMLVLVYLTLIVGSLTQYYFLIYSFFLTGTIIVILFLKKEIIKSLQYAIVSIMGIVTAYLIFPTMLKHVTETNRGTEVLDNLGNTTDFSSLKTFLTFVKNDLLSGSNLILISAITIMLICIPIINISNKNTKKIIDIKTKEKYSLLHSYLLLLIPVILYFLVIQHISYYKTPRYIYSIYPMIAILICISLYICLSFMLKNKKLVSIFSIVLFAGIVLLGYKNKEVDYLYKGYSESISAINNYQENNVIVLSDATWKNSVHVNEFRKFKSVFQTIVKNGTDVNLPSDNVVSSSTGIVVYITVDGNDKDLIDTVQKKYNFNKVDFLYEREGTNVYYFTK